jgi:pSer/pThr/pTyr-binding forkhead associated (FHA) protein
LFLSVLPEESSVPKIIIAQDGQVVQEIELSKERTTLGRHPRNDIVLTERTVSGDHCAITCSGSGATLEDLGSSNGTRVGGQRVTRHALADRQRFTIVPFDIEFHATPRPAKAAAPVMVPVPLLAPQAEAALPAGGIEVLSGNNAGKKLSLVKPLTTLGSPGVAVLVISRSASGFAAAHIDGVTVPTVNGEPLSKTPRPLQDGDQIDLAGTRMAFSTAAAAQA